MKGLTLTLTLTLIIFLSTLTAWCNEGEVIISTIEENIKVNGIIKVDIITKNLKDIYGIDISLKYDREYLRPIDNGFSVNSNLDDKAYYIALNYIDEENSVVRFMATSLKDNNFDAEDLISMNFKAIKPGATTLSLDKLHLLKKDLIDIKCTYQEKELIISKDKNPNSSSKRDSLNTDGYRVNNDLNITGVEIESEYVDNFSIEQVDIHKNQNDTLTLVSNIYDITYKAGQKKIMEEPNKETIIISLKYDDENNTVDEEKLGIYYFNEDRNQWIFLGGSVDKENNIISVEVNRIAKFAVFQNKDIKIFNDLENHWSYKYVRRLTGMGAIGGYEDNNFKPNNNITRAEFSKIIALALGLELKNLEIDFKDEKMIPKWATKYIGAVYSDNILKGYEDNTFRPNRIMTRKEIATAISQLLKDIEINTELNFVDNNEIPPWAVKGIKLCVENDILDGYDDNSIRPNKPVTRAEACKMIYMLLWKLKI